MKQRFNKQRKKLFLKISLTLTAVWLALSTAFFFICINSEKNKIQKLVIADLSNAHNNLSLAADSKYYQNDIFENIINLICLNTIDNRDWNTQLKVLAPDKITSYIDTTDKTIVRFGVKTSVESSNVIYSFIEYNYIRSNLTDEQFNEIKTLLETQQNDGKRYELVCTKFHIINTIIIPLEIKLILIDDESNWFISDKEVKTYNLEKNEIPSETIWQSNAMRRNIIPKNFLLTGNHSDNYIEMLSEQQREKASETVSIGNFEYIIYASDYIYMLENKYEKQYNDNSSDNGAAFIIQYAKKVNLLENCKTKLSIGISVIFAFFFVIAVILCLMIQKIMDSQMIEEQKRIDLTNALAHDIKTPLFVISGYAYSLKEDIDTSERDSYLDKIIEQADSINEMVHRMLSLSKLTSDSMTLNRTNFDLNTLIEELADNYKILPDNKEIIFHHSGDSTINGDKELLKTAVSNLIDNAVKYSLKSSNIKVTIEDKTLCIENESEPLTKNELKQIWQPYFRKDKSRNKNGNGLGLSIVKSIFELHEIKCEMSMKGSVLKCYADFS